MIKDNIWFISNYQMKNKTKLKPTFKCRSISHSMRTPRVLPLFCSSFSFNDFWLFMVYRRFVLTLTYKKKPTFVRMTLISVLCHVPPKISVVMLLVCSKVDWHKTLSLDILVFIATRYNHCWGVLDNLATIGTVNV
jgi:hypothetical protein